MNSRSILWAPLELFRLADRALSRRLDRRRVLVDARTPVNFSMVAPVFRAMAEDPRVQFFFTASEEPRRLASIYREAPSDLRLIHPSRAALMRFDAYLASDFMWQSLPRGARRVQMFHGVAGKYGFDTPGPEVRDWDRIFFINRRRLRNYLASGYVAADSPAIRLVGMPKVDCVVDGTYNRDQVLSDLGLDPSRSTVLYAPTWSPASSLHTLGVELIQRLAAMTSLNLIVKLHDRSRDSRPRYSGGIDWPQTIAPLLPPDRGVIAPGHNISPYLVAADLMITDHSSAGFEFLLRDRPLVRIHQPKLLQHANIHPEYVDLLALASESTQSVPETVRAVVRGLQAPETRAAQRRTVAEELFHEPGTATIRSVHALYEAVDLEPLPQFGAPAECAEVACPRSA